MPFTEDDVAGLIVSRAGGELRLRWASTAPEGTTYQVYLGSRLAWSGRQQSCALPIPPERTTIVVGRVDPGEEESDRSADPDFPTLAQDRAELAWIGGTFLGEGVRSFAVYGEPSPGAGIDYGTPVAIVPACMAEPVDGAGVGPAGQGGAGRAASSYRWRSGPLTSGTWHWGVRARDASGAEATAVEAETVIVAPPRPPAGLLVQGAVAGLVSLIWPESPDHIDP